MKLLLVEDNQQVAEVIFEYFEEPTYDLDYAATGTLGLQLASENSYQCIILDIMLPGIDGLTLCKSLRDHGVSTPIIMLTARDTNQDMLRGLSIGADDYILKPFDLELLEARIHAVVRRSDGSGFKSSITVGDLFIDLRTRTVTRENKLIKLNPSGFKILKLLCQRAPNTVSREEIERVLWPDNTPDQDLLRKHIYQLRTKIDKPFHDEIIVTVPKLGYKITSHHD